MKSSPPLTASLPWFPGFYESILDSFIGREVEQEVEGDPPFRSARTWEEVDEECNYQAARLAISKAWADTFASETGLEMEYESLESPREYNFTTDRCFVTLAPGTLAKLETVRESPEFAQVLKDTFTSCSGFISFYSPYVEAEEWQKPLAEWDHNQLGALIGAYVLASGTTREDLLESIHDDSAVYEAAQHVWDRVMV